MIYVQDESQRFTGVQRILLGTGLKATKVDNGIELSLEDNFTITGVAGSENTLTINNPGDSFGIRVNQTGAGSALRLDAASNRSHIRLTGDPTVAAPVDGDIWFDGTNLKIHIGTTTHNVDTTPA